MTIIRVKFLVSKKARYPKKTGIHTHIHKLSSSLPTLIAGSFSSNYDPLKQKEIKTVDKSSGKVPAQRHTSTQNHSDHHR